MQVGRVCWEGVLEKVKKDGRLLLMGDLNGRVGRDVETWEEVIGRHGEDTQNDNGYKEAKKNAKQAVREAKEKDLVREGKMLQRDYLGNRRRFWQKVKGEERPSKTSDSIEAKDGELLTE